MAHAAKASIPPGVALPWAAEGFSFTPPALWDQDQLNFGEQHYRDGGLFAQFSDLLQVRLIFRWYNKRADPKMMAISYVSNLAQEVKRNLPMGITPPEIIPGPFQSLPAPALNLTITKCVVRSGDMLARIYTFPWPDPEIKRTMLFCLAYTPAENNTEIEDWERKLLQSFAWQPPQLEGMRTWSLGGLQAEIPAYFMIWEAEPFAGQFKLALRPERRFLKQHPGEELVLLRRGLATLTLQKSSLHTVALGWLKTVQGPRTPKFDEGAQELQLRFEPGNPVSKLAAMAKTISKRARGDHLLGSVRLNEALNVLTGVLWFSHRPIEAAAFKQVEQSLKMRNLEGQAQMPAQAGLPELNKMPPPDVDARGKPLMSRQWQWRTMVLRNPEISTETIHDGLRLRMPVRPTKMTGLLRRFSGMGHIPLADRCIELDDLGAELWNQFDGKTDVWTITLGFSRKYHLGIRESERLIWQHLQNMVKRGIVGLAIPRMETSEVFENAGAQ